MRAPESVDWQQGGVRLQSRDAAEGRLRIWSLRGNGVEARVTTSGAGESAWLEVSLRGRAQVGVRSLQFLLEVEGKRVPLRAVEVRPSREGPRPELVIVQNGSSPELRLETRVRLVPEKQAIALSSKLSTRHPLERVRLGERVHWVGKLVAPDTERVLEPREGRYPWVGSKGPRAAAAMVVEGAPSEMKLRPQVGLQESFSASGRVASVLKRHVVVALGEGPYDRALSRAWSVSGRALGHMQGKLDPAPSWATIRARSLDGVVWRQVRVTAGGHYALELPRGSYWLDLESPGGSERVPMRLHAGKNQPPRFIVPAAAELGYQVRDARGQSLPARLLLHGSPPTANPSLGPVEGANGSSHLHYAGHRGAKLQLAPGRYRVQASRGPEYDLWRGEVEVSAEKGAMVKPVLRRVVDTQGWLAVDLHLHADPSGDSDVSLKDRVLSLMGEGVELAVATDHDHVTDYGPSIRELKARRFLRAAPGVEVTTRSWGHFNVFPLAPGAKPIRHDGLSASELFELVRNEHPRAVIQVNHPFLGESYGYFTQGNLVLESGEAAAGFSYDFDCIEVLNGLELNDPTAFERNLEAYFALLEQGRAYTAVGNSDSHRLAPQWVGFPRTYVQVPHDSPSRVSMAQVAEALRAGRTQVSTGPFLNLSVEGQGPGALVRSRGGKVRLRLRVQGAPWVDVRRVQIIVNGETVRDFPLPAARKVERFNGLFEIPIQQDGWIVVLARGRHELHPVVPGLMVPPVAFTSPVYVDGDGNGEFERTPPR